MIDEVNRLSMGSLFSGVGGLDLGLERAGMMCRWQVEIDEYATKVLEKHWPDVHRERDITQCGRHNLEQVDVIAAGFPCQDISYAGQGAGLAGERSGLFYEAIRIIRELGPRYVILENVAALLARGMGDVLGTLASVGYDAEWHCIPAASVGAPHIRDRVFVLAYANRKGLERQWKVAGGTSTQQQNISNPCRWAVAPRVCRVANGVPNRMDRIKGLGNAVVVPVAELIGLMLIDMATQ